MLDIYVTESGDVEAFPNACSTAAPSIGSGESAATATATVGPTIGQGDPQCKQYPLHALAHLA